MKKFKIVLIVIFLVVVVVFGGVVILQNKGIIGIQGDVLNIQVIKFVEWKEQVVLFSLGIEGLVENLLNKEIFGVGILWIDCIQFV